MRIPVPQLPGVAPQAPSVMVPGSVGTGGFEQIQQGLNAAGHAVDNTIASFQRAQHEAAVTEARDGLTAYLHDETAMKFGDPASGDSADGPRGLFSVKGRPAIGASTEALDELEKKRAERAEKMSDAGRKLYLAESARMFEGTRRDVAAHVDRQIEVAKEDTVNTAADEAVRAAAMDPSNDQLARERIGAVVGPIHALAGGRDDFANEKALEVRGKVAKARLDALLQAKNLDGVERVLQDNKYSLGADLPRYEEARRILRDEVGADGTALALVNGARKENGFIDQAKVVEALQAVPDAQRTPKLEQSVGKWMQLEQSKEKAQVDSRYDRAFSTYLGRHQLSDVDAGTEAWLHANAPEKWYALEQIDAAHKQHARGQPATPAQLRAFSQFRLWAADNPDQASQMTEQEFNRTWAPMMAKNDWDNAIGIIAGYHTYANKPEKMANAIDVAVQGAGGKGGAGVLPTEKRNKADWGPEELDVYAAATGAVQAYANQVRRSGKEPTPEQLRDFAKELFLSGKNPEGGFLGFGGGTTRVEAEVKGTGFEPKFSADEKAKATEALKAAGARIDDAAVENYLRRKHKLPALPIQARPATSPTEVVPGQWGLDLRPPPPAMTITDVKKMGM